MKKILYLHGLESKQGGKKVDFLTSKFITHAPSIDYRDENLEERLLGIMRDFNPDIIIGSSMGGYVGYLLSGIFDKECILFNPALHSRPFDPELKLRVVKGNHPKNPNLILGMDDEVINYRETLDYLDENEVRANIRIRKMSHRTPLNIFIENVKNLCLI